MSILLKVKNWLSTRDSEFWLVTGLLLVAAIAAGWNMFNFPYFENDEATYVSQAWSFVHSGNLAPYTYTYDHAPAGWMFMGLWFLITGGETTFGHNPLISGRIFIFILHIISVLLLYIITKRISRQKLAAYIAVVVFSLSPLELYFGRRVLLDNIMVFWMLVSIYFATKPNLKIRHVALSALTFGIAALSKENALFLAPAILYIIWIHTAPRIRVWAAAKWAGISFFVMALYPLYAFLHGELFPSGTALGGKQPHVSLIATTLQQSARGSFEFPWVHSSAFYTNLQEWVQRDPVIIIAGAICLIGTFLLNDQYKEMKAIAWTTIAGLLFLARGKLIIDFYILGLLPLFAIVIGNLAARPAIWAKNHISVTNYGIMVTLGLALVFVGTGTVAFTRNETKNQMLGIHWIEQHVSNKNAYIGIDDYAYPELHDVDGYKNADFDFKIQYDPAIQSSKYDGNWQKMQYLLITHEEIVQMHSGQLNFVRQAFNHSQLVADYRKNTTSFIDIQKLISTNGDWSQVYKVDPSNASILTNTWRTYKQNFITDAGQVVDPVGNDTTSEGQSYAMLRAIAMNDKVSFDNTWQWTKNNMQHKNDSLFSWKVTVDQLGINHVYDTNTATDGDEDIAMALIQAQQKWGGAYGSEAKSIVNSIWNHEVVNRNGNLYLLSSEAGSENGNLLINPSYIAPADYVAFAKLDTQHNWPKLTSDSFTLLNQAQSTSPAGLISNWIAVVPNGSITSTIGFNVSDPTNFGYDAFRISWRMAEDKADPRAQMILNKLDSFYVAQLAKNGNISASYGLDGTSNVPYSDVAPSAGAVIGLLASGNTSAAKEVYVNDIASKYNSSGYYWQQPYNYYDQNWGWFATQWYTSSNVGSL